MKKTVTRSLAAIFSVLIVGTTVSAEAPPYPLESTEIGLQPYEEMITITTAKDTSDVNVLTDGDTWETTHFYNAYRDLLNIDVVNEYEVADDYETKINLLMATDDLPDFFMATPVQLQQLMDAGQIQPITEAWNTYATDLLKQEFGKVDAVMESVTYDGEIMGIPYTGIIPFSMLWIRGDWREAVGVSREELETFDGWMKLAKAFIEDDPDGNGSDDTLGFTGPVFGISAQNTMGVTQMFGLDWMFNSYHGYPGIWIEKDGEVAYGSVQPEIKTALAHMAELYAEGLIDRDFAAQQQAYDLVSSQQSGIYENRQWGPTIFSDVQVKAPDAFWEYYPIPSADGEKAVPSVTVPVTGAWVVSSQCEHPEAVVKLANLFMDKTWNLKDQTEVDYYLQETASGVYINHRGGTAVSVQDPMEHYMSGLECARYWDGEITLDEMNQYSKSCVTVIDSDSFIYEPLFGEEGSISRLVVEMIDSEDYKMDVYNNAPTPTMVSKWSLLKDKEEEVFTRIIMGEDSVDAFDTFVEEWYAQGGQDITDEMNERFQ